MGASLPDPGGLLVEPDVASHCPPPPPQVGAQPALRPLGFGRAGDEDDVGERSRRAGGIGCSCGRWRLLAKRASQKVVVDDVPGE
jgi:hypothetical protein